MEFLKIVADVVLAPLFSFVKRQITYPFKAGDNVRDLQNVLRRLLNKKDDVKEKIEIAERNGQRQTHQVQEWLDEVEAAKTQVDAMVEKYNQRCLCFNRFSPNCCSNYTIGKTAAKKLLDVQKLLDYETQEEVAITPVPPPVQEVSVPTTSTSSSFANPNLEEALRCIKEDQEVGMIGIWGMGGVGKTHLLKQINNSFIGDSAFNQVFFVTASQSCTTETIQKQIVEILNLQQHEDVSRQSNIIFHFLRNKSFLMLLDDIWGRLELQDVGIPFPLGMVEGCKRKVVLTTRSINVCGKMEVRKKIKVKCLNDGEAWSLFLEKVGEETISSHPLIPRLAKEVSKELEGLPLALITTGRAMYEKKDPREWEYAIDLLKKSRLDEVEDQEGSTFCRLKFSYDSLTSDTLRESFLSCSMWPEDWWIEKEDLIECWMGLGLIKEFDSISEAYNTGHTLITYLIRACLLEEGERIVMAGLSEESERTVPAVRMHDVLRDMALWITHDEGKNKNKWMVFQHEALRDQQIWSKAERITLMQSDIKALPPIATTPCSSKLTTLMLSSNYKLRSLGDKFGALVALTYLNLSSCGFVHFPEEICGLVQLRYLNLSRNKMPSLPEELGSLINLKFLILRDTGIHTIPHVVIAKLKSLQVLDLFQNWSIGGLAELASTLLEELECLYDLKGLGICVQGKSQFDKLVELPNVPVRWLGISNLENSTSFSLSTSFLGDKQIQGNLAELCFAKSNATQYIVIEGNHQQPTWQLRALENLYFHKMHGLEEIIWKGVVPKELFRALRFLNVVDCDKLKSISWILHLPCLMKLRVIRCSSMRELIADTVEKEEEKEMTSTATFPCLREIELEDLPELVSICHSAFALPALENICFRHCLKLKKLPFRPGNISSKLRFIDGSNVWWEGLDWEDSSVRTSFLPFYKEKIRVDMMVQSAALKFIANNNIII
ncbi:probable disease resistance protein At5g63020 [Typha angustifolia]|uniref:probable disease resistance protein At5g63020 n=1 Tax=Typha angustifolia TaxID=59011 RepID=UPI003C2C830C